VVTIKNIVETIKQYKIIVIMRNVSIDKIISTAQALYEGGIRLVEVTFNQASATGEKETATAIAMLCQRFKEKMLIGAGTVMNENQVRTAVDAGAKYIISPNTDLQVIKKTIEMNAVSIPGAFTPSEIVSAYAAGASFVKVFPAGEFGTGYLKAIRSPLNHIPLIAVGGIDEHNMEDFFKAGVVGVGIGSNMVNNQLINMEKYADITELAKKYTQQL
jgi:2-dehydro-3-deoxyphosphogluconate aldolase / (4S)-4-hydroxy-2-oxoglutarate aldolase